MIYIFEDHPDSDISILFKSAYREDAVKSFIYSEGNGNLENLTSYYVSNTDEKVIVFMDMIPGNKDCVSIYNSLRSISVDNNYKVWVWPLVCEEYYMIKSISDKHLFIDESETDFCINKRPHVLSALMTYSDKARYCKNFEKYCKYILKFNVANSCLMPYNKTQMEHGEYYRKDCKCNASKVECLDKTLIDKAIDLLIAYKYVPAGSKVTNAKTIFENELWRVHRTLVDEYNDFVDAYKGADPNSCNKYKKIKYIK